MNGKIKIWETIYLGNEKQIQAPVDVLIVIIIVAAHKTTVQQSKHIANIYKQFIIVGLLFAGFLGLLALKDFKIVANWQEGQKRNKKEN